MARCRGCKGEVTGVRAGFHARDPYCSEKCRVGGMQVVCWTCKKPATLVGDWHHCEACGPPPLKKRRVECELDERLNQNVESLTMANNMFRFGVVPKEGGDDAKQRKRA